jgi:hypothetical protein
MRRSDPSDNERITPFARFARQYDKRITDAIDLADYDAHYYWNVGAILTGPEPERQAEMEFANVLYGDTLGKSYIESIQKFTAGMDSKGFDFSEKINHLTRGAHKFVEATRKLGKTSGSMSKAQKIIVDSEIGSTDVGKRLEYCKGELDRLLEASEADFFKSLGAKSTALLSKPIPNQIPSSAPIQISPILFEQNRTDLAHLFNTPNDTNKLSKLDLIRRRLLCLAKHSKDLDLEINNK